MSAASVWGWVAVFSDGFFFRGVASAPSTGGMQEAAWRICGLLVWRLARGSGVSLVTFRKELLVFYPLNFTPTFVGTGCAAVVAVKPRRVHLPGEELQLFSGGSAFCLGVF